MFKPCVLVGTNMEKITKKQTTISVEEEVFSGEGASPAVGRRMKRVRSSSEGSPEGEIRRKGWWTETRGRVAGYTREVDTVGEELMSYISKNFSKERHESFFLGRINKIKDSCAEMALEIERMGRVVDKVCDFEGRVLSKWGEFDKIFELFEERVVEKIRKENQEVLERVKGEVSQLRQLIESEDAQRQGDVDRVEKNIKGQGKETRNFIEDECRRVSTEVVEKVDSSLGLVRVGQQKVEQEVKKIGTKVEEIRDKCKDIEVGKGSETMEIMNVQLNKVAEEMGEVRKEINRNNLVQPMEVDGEENKNWAEVTKRTKKKRGAMVVVQTPKGVERGKSREVLGNCLNTKSGEIRVKAIRNQGKDFVMEVHDNSDIDKLRALGLEEKGFVVDGEPRLNDPKIIIYEVDQDIEQGDILEAIRIRNRELFEDITEVNKEIRISFSRKARNGINWIIQVSPKLFKRIIGKGRIYLGLRSCRVAEFVGVMRCYKCQNIGHTGRFCGASVVCGRCGEEGHHSSNCKEPQKLGCGNCKRAGFKETEHWVGWRECPVMEIARRRAIMKTRYE
jgi:hypothetical protein